MRHIRNTQNLWPVVAIVIFVLIMLFSIGYYVNARSDCAQARGVLVKNLNNTYACMEKGQH